MKILVVEPHKVPRVEEIPNTLEAMQEIVGGLIEPVYLHDGDAVLVCNDEGKLIGLEGNRRVDGQVIAGTFFVCGDDGEDFCSLSDEQLEKYADRFAKLETIERAEVEADSGYTIISWGERKEYMTLDEVKNYPHESLVLQGCGGEPQEWVDGINEMLTQTGILLNGSKFKKAESFSIGGHTNLLLDMENVDLNIGKLAMWRIQTYGAFGGMWLSDFKINRLGCSDPGFEETEVPDMKMGGM